MNLTNIFRHRCFVRFEQKGYNDYRLILRNLLFGKQAIAEIHGTLEYVIEEGANRLLEFDAEASRRVIEVSGQVLGQAAS